MEWFVLFCLFIKNKKSWGYVFRFGFLKIDQESFEIIAQNMIGKNPLKKVKNMLTYVN